MQDRVLRSYLIAWVVYAGLVLGGVLHQLVFYGNFRISGCDEAFFFSPVSLFIGSVIGIVVGGVVFFATTLLRPTLLESRHVLRTSAAVVGLCALVTFTLSQGDASIERGCM